MGEMSDDTVDHAAGPPMTTWRASWDQQQEKYLPHREEAFSALLDAVHAIAGQRARVLDLAGGTGSISLRLLDRMPDAQPVLLDLDPVLVEIASASLPSRVPVIRADLRDGRWIDALPHRSFHAVLTTTAMHCLAMDRLGELYREIRQLLVPRGIFVNADRMPDNGQPGLTDAGQHWQEWWRQIAADQTLGPLMAARGPVPSEDWYSPVSAHLTMLKTAGFDEACVLWRRDDQAAVMGVAR
jgi:trans-aconitate methyltransferase